MDERVINPANSLRVAQLTTLFDGKLINRTGTDTDMWSEASGGTGSFDYTNPEAVRMNVLTTGDYAIRQSNRYLPYFSGKVQDIEGTFDDFAPQSGVIKRFGYFSSSGVAPFDAQKDGLWLESNGVTGKIEVVTSYMGTETLRVPVQTIGKNIPIGNYNWNNFTVVLFRFLWLGGAALTLDFVYEHMFVPLITTGIAGRRKGTICRFPHQTLRYEIRSVGGAGTFNSICSMVATGGSVNESGRGRIVKNLSTINCNNVDTHYVLAAIRKNTISRNHAVMITSLEASITATTDAGLLTLYKNPVIAGGALSWAAHESQEFDTAFGNGTLTMSGGREIESKTITTAGVGDANLRDNFMGWLTQGINNVADTMVLGYIPLTSNQGVRGVMHIKTL